jgi:hypothetical protein
MRLLAPLFVTTVTLAACAAVGTSAGSPVVPPAAEGPCSNSALSSFIGQKASQDLGTQMLAASGGRVLRWVPHGAMVTMEYRAERLTVRLNQTNMVESATCG